MNPSRIETWVWVLIYGGLLLLGLGFSARDALPVIGHGLIVVGAVMAVGGVVLIVVRSRMKDAP